MVIKRDRKEQSSDKESSQDGFITRADYHQPNETNQQNDKFCDHHVSENSSNEESLFAFEERAAVWAMVPDVKRFFDNGRLSAGWTEQPDRSQ
jgi:hypothetical protein